MLDYLYNLSDIHLFFLLSIFTIVVSLVIITVLHKVNPITLKNRDNAVIGTVASLIGVIYGVLVGLTALFLIDNISAAVTSVQNEANAVANIYRDSKWLPDPTRTHIQQGLVNYLEQVITVEWPQMIAGHDIEIDKKFQITALSQELFHSPLKEKSDAIIMQSMLTSIHDLYNARQQRNQINNAELTGEMWFVILIGTVLTICIVYFFKISYALHIISVSAAALMASSMIFLLVTLDRPFQGEFTVDPSPYQAVLDQIKNEGGK